MEYRELRGGKEKVSLLGFGCMRLPRLHPDKPEIDTELGQRMVDYAYSHGVNYFDTAYPYHEGLSEPFIGAALSQVSPGELQPCDQAAHLGSSTARQTSSTTSTSSCKSAAWTILTFTLSTRSDAERFETVQKLHIFENLCELKAKGKIRHIGFSFHDKPDVLERILAAHDWEFAQIQLNYLDWELQDAKRQYEITRASWAFPCIVMEPVRGGALATLTPEAVDSIFKSWQVQTSSTCILGTSGTRPLCPACSPCSAACPPLTK